MTLCWELPFPSLCIQWPCLVRRSISNGCTRTKCSAASMSPHRVRHPLRYSAVSIALKRVGPEDDQRWRRVQSRSQRTPIEPEARALCSRRRGRAGWHCERRRRGSRVRRRECLRPPIRAAQERRTRAAPRRRSATPPTVGQHKKLVAGTHCDGQRLVADLSARAERKPWPRHTKRIDGSVAAQQVRVGQTRVRKLQSAGAWIETRVGERHELGGSKLKGRTHQTIAVFSDLGTNSR